jgi:hypothetical protein
VRQGRPPNRTAGDAVFQTLARQHGFFLKLSRFQADKQLEQNGAAPAHAARRRRKESEKCPI